MSASGSAVVQEDRLRGDKVVAEAMRRLDTAKYKLTVLRAVEA